MHEAWGEEIHTDTNTATTDVSEEGVEQENVDAVNDRPKHKHGDEEDDVTPDT